MKTLGGLNVRLICLPKAVSKNRNMVIRETPMIKMKIETKALLGLDFLSGTRGLSIYDNANWSDISDSIRVSYASINIAEKIELS